MTIPIRQDLANLIDETVQLRQSDGEDEGRHNALTPYTVQVQPDAPAINEEEIISEVAIRDPPDRMAGRFPPF